MAVKTNFTENDIVNILSKYQLGEFIDSKPIDTGTIQTNILLKTTQGKFVLRYYESRSQGSVSFEINLLRYLKDRKYPCPAVVNNAQGHCIDVFRGKPYAVFEFVEGNHIERPTEKQKMQLIRKVAELQNITANYRPRNRCHRWNYGIDLCKKLAQAEARRINTINSRAKEKWVEAELSKLILPKSLPKGICHCDFHFSNVLFKNGKFNALIDFDDANYTYLMYDLVCLIEPFIPSYEWNTWEKFNETDNVFCFKGPRQVVHEYNKYRKLNSNEKRHLFDLYKLNVLFDCVWYFGRGKGEKFYEKSKIDYLNNLGRNEFYDRLF